MAAGEATSTEYSVGSTGQISLQAIDTNKDYRNFDIKLYNSDVLLAWNSATSILTRLNALVNKSFAENHRALLPPDVPSGPRYYAETQIVDEMGPHGRCCVVFDIEGGKKEPVVVGSMKPYNDAPLTVEDAESLRPAETELKDIKDWELSAVAVKWDPKYLKRGLAGICVKALEDDLIKRLQHVTSDEVKVTVWCRTAKDVNLNYWKKRGFEEVSEVLLPKGTYYSTRAFIFATLKKIIP